MKLQIALFSVQEETIGAKGQGLWTINPYQMGVGVF